MKYFIIAGEASGDLHASNLMRALKENDESANFYFYGGDFMAKVGGRCLKHYSELAYMGFIPVLLHLPTILRNMSQCKQYIKKLKPDVVILVDYPGFNLNIAKSVKKDTNIPVYYYISPKIWAWKEYRINSIKKNVDELFSILPFEVPFFEEKHHYPIHYVGNPTMEEITEFKHHYTENISTFCLRNNLKVGKAIIALMAGSRKQEIKDNLGYMYEAAKEYIDKGMQLVLAGAPNISPEYYHKILSKYPGAEAAIHVVYKSTYPLLSHSDFALVTSGTATLEVALFNVPQIVCYYTPIGKFFAFLRKHLLKVKYISLVNLIAAEEVIPELVADTMTVKNIKVQLSRLIFDVSVRKNMLKGYAKVQHRLKVTNSSENVATKMLSILTKSKKFTT